MIKKLLSIFTGKQSAEPEKTTSEPCPPQSQPERRAAKSVTPEKASKDIIGFVDYVVRALVDNPAAVKIEVVESEKGQIININCEKEDIGKIIGKSGKTIMAIRSLVAGAGSRLNRQMSVEVVDQVAN